MLDTIMSRLYGIGKEGLALCGMDDAGEMSAWYVFASTGVYPLTAADTRYVVSVPVFDQVTWKLADQSLTINKKGSTRAIDAILVNGQKKNDYFISYDLFKTGGTIDVGTK